MKKSSVLLFSLLLATSFTSTISVAEDLQIVNKTKEDITVEIIPEEETGEVLPGPGITKTISSKDESTLMIDNDDLKGKKFMML